MTKVGVKILFFHVVVGPLSQIFTHESLRGLYLKRLSDQPLCRG